MPERGKGFYWVYIPEFNLAICAPPKCASRSLLFTLAKRYYGCEDYQAVRPSDFKRKDKHYMYLDAAGVQSHWRRLAIIRHPIERFISLWAHHCRDGTPGIPNQLRKGASMHDLLDYIEENQNAHWMPQSQIIRDSFRDTLYTTTDNAAYTLTLLTAGKLELEHENKTQNKKNIAIPPDVLIRIREIYTDDFDMCDRVMNG
jgi:hypothetical protein